MNITDITDMTWSPDKEQLHPPGDLSLDLPRPDTLRHHQACGDRGENLYDIIILLFRRHYSIHIKITLFVCRIPGPTSFVTLQSLFLLDCVAHLRKILHD